MNHLPTRSRAASAKYLVSLGMETDMPQAMHRGVDKDELPYAIHQFHPSCHVQEKTRVVPRRRTTRAVVS
jgi:hypothetical protein